MSKNINILNIDTSGFKEPTALAVSKLADGVSAVYGDVKGGAASVISHFRQSNIQSVVKMTLGKLTEGASGWNSSRLNNDWMVNVISKASMSSDEYVQDMWAKIISGEIKSPGKFSKHMIEVADKISYDNAKLFIKIGQFLGDDTPLDLGHLVIHDILHRLYSSQGFCDASIQGLEVLGLIQEKDKVNISSYDIKLRKHGDNHVVITGVHQPKFKFYAYDRTEVVLTSVGREFLSIDPLMRNKDYFTLLMQVWKDKGLNPTVISNKEFDRLINIEESKK